MQSLVTARLTPSYIGLTRFLSSTLKYMLSTLDGRILVILFPILTSHVEGANGTIRSIETTAVAHA